MKLLRANCEQIALLQAMLAATGNWCRILPVSSSTRTFEVQKEFKAVVFAEHGELQCRNGILPVRVDFEYHVNENVAFIRTNRKGIEVLKEIFPDTFEKIELLKDEKKEEEIPIEVKPFTTYKKAQIA